MASPPGLGEIQRHAGSGVLLNGGGAVHADDFRFDIVDGSVRFTHLKVTGPTSPTNLSFED